MPPTITTPPAEQQPLTPGDEHKASSASSFVSPATPSFPDTVAVVVKSANFRGQNRQRQGLIRQRQVISSKRKGTEDDEKIIKRRRRRRRNNANPNRILLSRPTLKSAVGVGMNTNIPRGGMPWNWNKDDGEEDDENGCEGLNMRRLSLQDFLNHGVGFQLERLFKGDRSQEEIAAAGRKFIEEEIMDSSSSSQDPSGKSGRGAGAGAGGRRKAKAKVPERNKPSGGIDWNVCNLTGSKRITEDGRVQYQVEWTNGREYNTEGLFFDDYEPKSKPDDDGSTSTARNGTIEACPGLYFDDPAPESASVAVPVCKSESEENYIRFDDDIEVLSDFDDDDDSDDEPEMEPKLEEANVEDQDSASNPNCVDNNSEGELVPRPDIVVENEIEMITLD